MNAYQLQVKSRALRYDVVTLNDLRLGCSWRYIPGCWGNRVNPPEFPEADIVHVIRLDTCTTIENELTEDQWDELNEMLVNIVEKEKEISEQALDKALTDVWD